MNTNTKEELQNLSKQLQVLSFALLLQIGMETATQVAQAAQGVIDALESDETIVEVQ